MKTFALALLMVMLILPVAAGQTPDLTDIVTDYVQRIENEEMSLMVVHLNDFTTDAFFSPPTKYSLRAQARLNMMFFIQGVAKRDITVDTNYKVVQRDQSTQSIVTSLRTIAINILNFEDGTLISEGEEFQGIISTPAQSINLRAPFDVQIGEFHLRFELSTDAVDRIRR